MTREQVEAWATKAEPGQKIIYRTGRQLAQKPHKDQFCPAVHAVRQLYNLGMVDLVQRRTGGEFEYIAIWRSVVRPPIPAFSREGKAVHRFRVPVAYAEAA